MDQKWYQDFVSDDNLSREMLFDLLTAANYMGIKPLLDLTCLKVTFQLTGKNAEEVSSTFVRDCEKAKGFLALNFLA
jgi:S-phase kinase-associated protein 1